MKQLTVEAAFQWMRGFVAREWRLLLPVALAFFALPGLVFDLVLPNAMQLLMPGTPPGTPGQGSAMLAMVVVAAIYCLGALATTALALVPGISVQEAIGRGVRRWPVLIGSVLLVSAAILLALTVMALLLGQALAAVQLQKMLISVIVIGGGLIWVRLAIIVPLLVHQPMPPVRALKASWEITGGAFWRLLGALALYTFGGLIVTMALSSAIGVIIMVVARVANAPDVGQVVSLVVFRLIAALISTGFQLLVVGLYRQLAASRH